VINPGYFAGCASTEEDNAPDFSAMTAQMEQSVHEANDSYDVDIDGVAYRLDVDIEPVRSGAEQPRRPKRAFAQTAHACGKHKLVSTAQACIDSFEMDVPGHVTLLRAVSADQYEEVASDVKVIGALEAISSAWSTLSLRFDGGRVTLQRENAKAFELDTHELQALITK
jgi:hypothetical protein